MYRVSEAKRFQRKKVPGADVTGIERRGVPQGERVGLTSAAKRRPPRARMPPNARPTNITRRPAHACSPDPATGRELGPGGNQGHVPDAPGGTKAARRPAVGAADGPSRRPGPPGKDPVWYRSIGTRCRACRTGPACSRDRPPPMLSVAETAPAAPCRTDSSPLKFACSEDRSLVGLSK